MATDQITYQDLDDLLTHLGFHRDHINAKWLRYQHSDSGTEIILVDKKPAEQVRPTDAWSAREHLLQKGLITEKELDKFLKSVPSK